MKNNKQKTMNIFIACVPAIALAFAACSTDPEIERTQPDNELLREKTASDESGGMTIGDFIDISSLSSINVGTADTYEITTKKLISLDTLKSALKWSTLTTTLTENFDNQDPPYEYPDKDSL